MNKPTRWTIGAAAVGIVVASVSIVAADFYPAGSAVTAVGSPSSAEQSGGVEASFTLSSHRGVQAQRVGRDAARQRVRSEVASSTATPTKTPPRWNPTIIAIADAVKNLH